jgi:hypothetical protein
MNTREASLVLAALMACTAGCRIKAIATATGQPEIPGEHFYPEVVTNGDFVISDLGVSPFSKKVGDAWNEVTDWTFDFNRQSPPNWPKLGKITKATLELHLYVDGEAPQKDVVRLKYFAETKVFPAGVTPKTHVKVAIDLLKVCTGEEILRQLALEPKGQLRARYEDDALVYKATLTLQGHRK